MSKYSISNRKKQFDISEEVATEQLVELLDYYDIDVERLTAGETKEEKLAAAGLEKSLDQIRDAIRAGVVEIVRDGSGKMTVVQTISNGEKLTYGEVSSKAKLAAEKFDQNAGYSRIYAFMGSLAGCGDTAIKKLPARDLGIVEVLGTVFMNA